MQGVPLIPTVKFSTPECPARVLIVEDEAIVADDIQAILEDLGYVASGIATSATEALNIVESQGCDIALMDIKINGPLDGIETAGLLKQRFNLPVLYLTAHTDDATFERARATGPFGYVPKPVTPVGIKIALGIGLERHRFQRQLEEREFWLHSALTHAGEAVLISNQDGFVSFLNPVAADLLAVSQNAALNRKLDDILQLDCNGAGPRPLRASPDLSHLENPTFRLGSLCRPDGSRRQILISVAPIAKGSLPGWAAVSILTDISDLHDTEQKIKEANRLLARSNDELSLLSQSLMHDLREPLNTVSLCSQLLERSATASFDPESLEYIEDIRASCARMLSLMEALRDYSSAVVLDRMNAEPINTAIPFREALQNLAANISSSRAQIQCADLPAAFAHPTALILIFQNLIGNAIKYAGDHIPQVRVSAVRAGDFWQFTVADQGIGFHPSQAEKIFGLFKRAHGPEQSGSGIGLAICKRLVEQHNGRIWAESEPGQGASFHFTLPAVTKQAISAKAHAG